VTSAGEPAGTGPGDDRDELEIELLGRRVRILEISCEVTTTMPIYPGHVGVAFWPHLTQEQVRQRLPEDAGFQGYAVRGMVASEHVSTHVDAIWHFNPERPGRGAVGRAAAVCRRVRGPGDPHRDGRQHHANPAPLRVLGGLLPPPPRRRHRLAGTRARAVGGSVSGMNSPRYRHAFLKSLSRGGRA
jgi:Putative cyclase